MEATWKNSGSTSTTSADSKIRKDSILNKSINITHIAYRARKSNRIYIISREHKNLNHITHFNYNKKSYYAST